MSFLCTCDDDDDNDDEEKDDEEDEEGREGKDDEDDDEDDVDTTDFSLDDCLPYLAFHSPCSKNARESKKLFTPVAL